MVLFFFPPYLYSKEPCSSNNMYKWWMKIWFLTCQMPVLSGRTNFDPFLKTWKFFTPKFPMKYSKNGQNFTTPKNTWNVIFETCWTPCKKPHFSMWPRSRNTFFWLTPYMVDNKKMVFGIFSIIKNFRIEVFLQ